MTNKQKKPRIAMAGGGTGGHVFPIRSLLQFLSLHSEYRQDIDNIYWFGSKRSLEAKVCQEIQQDIFQKITFIPIRSGKYRRESYRKSKLKNIPDFFLFMVGIFQSIFYLLRYRIDVIFCKGGYVALPVVLAGALLRKKIVVHESDTRPGLVNKIANRFATKTFTGFDGALPNAQTIGQLLSDDIIVDINPTPSSRTLVLVSGGSQGSQKLYHFLLNIFQTNPDLSKTYEFHFVLGLLNDEMSTDFDTFPRVHTYSFLSQKEMGELYNLCDIAITRGGTTTLAEQKLYNLSQIIVPIPWTHDQYDNAKRYAKHYQDLRLNQRDKDFEAQLLSAIQQYKGFKKVPSSHNKSAIITKAKVAVWKSLLDKS